MPARPMKSSAVLPLPVLSLLVLAGCVLPASTGVIRLGDGVLQARSPEEAETFCRTTGDPIRLLELPGTAPQTVRFRCD